MSYTFIKGVVFAFVANIATNERKFNKRVPEIFEIYLKY